MTRIWAMIVWASLLGVCTAEHYKVYLIGGQSNGTGRGDAAQLTGELAHLNQTHTNILFYYHKTLDASNNTLPEDTWVSLAPGSGHGRTSPVNSPEFGPELAFGYDMAQAFPDDHIAIIKYTHGGSTLYEEWSPTGTRYPTFLETIDAALADLDAEGHTYEMIGMLWQQGEHDRGTGPAAAYEENLTLLISRVRRDLFDGCSLPFVIGGLSSNQTMDVYDVSTGSGKVRLAQETVAANVDGAGFANSDGCQVFAEATIHFDGLGQAKLGAEHAAVMIQLEALDTDYDGLSADQETTLGTDPGNPDSDGDGQKDGFEYRAGTDPLNSNSVFKVNSIVVASNEVTLNWPSKAENSYRVDHSVDLSEWTKLEDAYPAAATGTNTVWSYELSSVENPGVVISNVLALYDAEVGTDGNFDNEAFDSVDTEPQTTATRLSQGGSLDGGGAGDMILNRDLFDTSDSGAPGFNLANVNLTSQSAAAAAGDWFSFTLQSNGYTANYESLSFYTDQTSSGANVDISYTLGGTETFIIQNYEPPTNNVDVELMSVDFSDFSSSEDVVWTFYIYGAPASSHGTRFDDITLHGTATTSAPVVLALYDAETGGNGDFNTEAFDSVDTEAGTTASRMFQGGSLSGGGSSSYVLGNGLFDASASGSPGFNLADVNVASQSAAATAGDWFAFTIDPEGSSVDYSSLSFYTDQASSGGKVDVSYTTGTTETFILQSYSMAEDNASVELIDVDFDDFSSSNIVTWTFYLYGTPDYRHGIRFDDITLYGKSDAVIEPEEEPAAGFYRVNLQ
ncbi:sialate O-acetylesterase [Pontiellaceae bacterium B1224]|nr:sialate O-acetylesterase [Pontiellaceae bacterium B1224]